MQFCRTSSGGSTIASLKGQPQSHRALPCVAAAAMLTLASMPAFAANLAWDANAALAGQTDGGNPWLGANQWWTGSANTNWVSGSDATFGYSTAGGSVTLASPTTVGSLTFNPFITTAYTLGTVGQALTINNGITMNTGGAVTFISPITLGSTQTWTSSGAGALTLNDGTNSTINTNGHTLTFKGIGSQGKFNIQRGTGISGGGGIIVDNAYLDLRMGGNQSVNTFSGGTTVQNGGEILYFSQAGGTNGLNLGSGNVTLDGGILSGYFNQGITAPIGAGAGQFRITGGVSGFGVNGAMTVNFNNVTSVQWGSASFNPSKFVLGGGVNGGTVTFAEAIDLNGANRTITSSVGGVLTAAVSTSTGTAGLIKEGAGNLDLRAANTYNGTTTINGGTLTLSSSGTIANTTALNLGGGTLQLTNTAQVDRFANVAISATAGGGVTYTNTAGAVNYTESLGALTLTKGQVNVLLTNDHNAAAGSQTLTFGTAGTGNLTQGGGKGTITFSAPTTGLNATKNRVAVFGATATPAGGIIGPWATVGTAANVQTAFAAYDASGYVIAATPTVAAVDTDLSSASGNYDINTGSAFTLSGTRTVNAVQFRGAASTLDLGTNRLETNGFFFSGGAANAKTITGTGTGALTTPSGGGNLYITTGQVMTAGNEHRISAPITDNSGVVHLVKSGAGTLRLNGVNTFTGDIDINAGTLQIGTNATANGAKLGSTGTYAGNIFIAAGANLDFQTDADQILSGVISGDGNLLKRHIGTLTLGDDNTYTGKTTIGAITNTTPGATLVVSSFNSYNGGTPLLANSSLGAPTTLANATIEMGSNNSSPNPTLRYAGAAATGETTDRIINFVFNSSATRTLDASGSGLLKFTSPFTSAGLNTGQLALTGTGTGEIAGLPFLFNNLTKSGSGTWTLAGTSGSIGLVSVSAGTLIATHERALGAAIGNLATTGVTISGTGTLGLRNNSSTTFGVAGTGYNINNSASGATINVDRVSGTGAATMTVGNLTTTSTAGSWQLNFTGANGVSLNAGALTAPLSTTATTHTINNNIATTNDASLTLASINAPSTNAAPVLNFTGTGTTIVAGNITQATAALAMTKNGTGKVILNGSASYTGATTVSNGTLLVNGSLAAGSAVTVNGGVLGGDGTINGSVTVNAGGTFSPGNSPGQIDVGTLSLAGTTLMELGGTTLGSGYDSVTVATSSGLTYGGGLSVVNFGLYNMDTPNVPYIYDLFAFTGLASGSFSTVSVNSVNLVNALGVWTGTNGGVSYSFDQGTGDLTIAVVPEPTTLGLLAMGAVGLMRRRRVA